MSTTLQNRNGRSRNYGKLWHMDYDLDRLGALEFEHMVQALAAAELGTSVTVFGAGPDGGREATFRASKSRAPGDAGGEWDGYGIVQAKSQRFAGDVGANASALVASVRAELNLFVARNGQSPVRTPSPKNYIVATNARLSAGQGGGIDRVLGALRDHPVGLSGYAVWHYEHICRLLDRHVGIRKTDSPRHVRRVVCWCQPALSTGSMRA